MIRLPDKNGYYGEYGGRFVPETLFEILEKLHAVYKVFRRDKQQKERLDFFLKQYAGRPTPLYLAESFAKELGGPKIFLKREDLLHTGAHKINNTIGQILLADYLGKKRIIAETGAGQHGVATASVAAKFGKKCVVYMGEEDMRRQSINVFRMRLLGAEVIPVKSGSRTLKDATSEAIRDWVANAADSYYLIGSTVGPHPYPMIVRDFQSVIGIETKRQIKQQKIKNLSHIIACVGGGSNAMGMFYPFKDIPEPELIGVEAAGCGLSTKQHAATLTKGKPGVLHGSKSYLLQDKNGQIELAHSVSAGLDYPGVGPEHSFLKDSGRVRYMSVTDAEAVSALQLLSQSEGIIPALESSHALAAAIKLCKKISKDNAIIINLSGRGDKDLGIIEEYLNANNGRS
ncbi:tryptophan synthase subunit beta [candidate division KSB1 bacterium]